MPKGGVIGSILPVSVAKFRNGRIASGEGIPKHNLFFRFADVPMGDPRNDSPHVLPYGLGSSVGVIFWNIPFFFFNRSMTYQI